MIVISRTHIRALQRGTGSMAAWNVSPSDPLVFLEPMQMMTSTTWTEISYGNTCLESSSTSLLERTQLIDLVFSYFSIESQKTLLVKWFSTSWQNFVVGANKDHNLFMMTQVEYGSALKFEWIQIQGKAKQVVASTSEYQNHCTVSWVFRWWFSMGRQWRRSNLLQITSGSFFMGKDRWSLEANSLLRTWCFRRQHERWHFLPYRN